MKNIKMNKLGILDLKKVCRLCLSESENTYSIFTEVETEGFKFNIPQLLSKIADIWLLDCKELPNKVCHRCLEFLIEISKYLKSCLNSNKIIQTYHEELKAQEFEIKQNVKEEVIQNENCDNFKENTISEDNILEEGRVNETEDIQKDSCSDGSYFEDASIDIKDEILQEVEETQNPSSDLNYYLQTLENGETEFACNLCPAHFKYTSDFVEHILTHGEEPFVCSGCKKSHKHYQHLLMHIKYPKSHEFNAKESDENVIGLNSYLQTQECGNDVYVCSKCSGHFFVDKEFNQLSYKAFLAHLMRHIRGEATPFEEMTSEMLKYNNYNYYSKTLEDGTKTYVCNLCEEHFTSEQELKEHLPSHGDQPHWCSECKKGFIQHHLLMIHVKNQHIKNPYQCDLCEKSYKRRTSLTTHKRIHNGDKPYLCSFCGKVFKDSAALRTHLVTHSEERNHKCSQCRAKFKTKRTLLKHLKRHFNENFIPKVEKSKSKTNSNYRGFAYYAKTLENGKKIYACNVCDEQFELAHELKEHLPSHGDKAHWCNECKKGFGSHSLLRVHRQRHSGKKRYLCDLCENSYRDSESLILHQKLHKEERPYLCSQCGKAFKHSNALKMHLISHSDEYNHSCNHCDKKYKRLKTLKEHLKTHTGKKIYKCSECPKEFYRLDQLKGHQNTHAGLKPYVCEICQKAFRRKFDLQTHIKSHSWVCEQQQ